MSKDKEEKKDPGQLLQELLDKHNLTIQPQPQFMPRDDGTFSVVVRLLVDYKE